MIEYIDGDATEPIIKEGVRIIAHIVNDAGKWGAGFSGAVSAKWEEPEARYREKSKGTHWRPSTFKLGCVQWVFVEVVETELAICNMCAQHGVRHQSNRTPIRYDALDECLDKLAQGARGFLGERYLKQHLVTIHLPRIGAGLAGGSWDRIESLIEERLWDLPVYVYNWKG